MVPLGFCGGITVGRLHTLVLVTVIISCYGSRLLIAWMSRGFRLPIPKSYRFTEEDDRLLDTHTPQCHITPYRCHLQLILRSDVERDVFYAFLSTLCAV